MSTRISVSKQELRKIQEQLKKQQGLTLNDISQHIDSEFKDYLYKGLNMSPETFRKLEDLYEGTIKYEEKDFRNGVSYKNRVEKIEKNERTAEFIGVLLGDGNLTDFSYETDERYVTNYRIKVTVNEKERLLIEKVKELFYDISGKEPSIYDVKGDKGYDIIVYSKDLIEELKKLGLKPGNKVKNQIGVPDWIKNDEKYIKNCLRGLIDTDGTIYTRGRDGYKVVQFKNRSEPLLNDFAKMCEDLGIRTSSGGQYTVQVAAQDEVSKFIKIIEPIKSVDK